MSEYDFVVIGGGSAGYAGARTAVECGMRTVVVEGGAEVGGLCILRGCMPSKALLECAARYRVLRRAGEYGLRADGIGYDLREVVARKRRLVGEFADYRRGQLEDGGFDFLRGRAAFVDRHTVEVSLAGGGAVRLRGEAFLVATGSEVSFPPVPGLAESGCLTSDAMLELEELPESLIVLGAGPVGLEMASYASAFGVRTTVIQRSGHVLSGVDADVAAALEAGLREEGIEVITGTGLVAIEPEGPRWRVSFEKDGEVLSAVAGRVMNALGRRPCVRGLEALGLEMARGRVVVGADQATSVGHVFAAGDVCGGLEVVHVAIEQGEAAARNAALLLGRREGGVVAGDRGPALFAVFSEPQCAVAGVGEEALARAGIDCASAVYPFNDHGKSLVMGETAGMVKLIAERGSGRLLGGAVVGPEAAELIHEVVVALRYGATAAGFAAIPHYHPTLSEIWTYPAEELAGVC